MAAKRKRAVKGGVLFENLKLDSHEQLLNWADFPSILRQKRAQSLFIAERRLLRNNF